MSKKEVFPEGIVILKRLDAKLDHLSDRLPDPLSECLKDCRSFPETRKELSRVLVPYYFSGLLKDLNQQRQEFPYSSFPYSSFPYSSSAPVWKSEYDTALALFDQSMERLDLRRKQ